MLQDPQSDDIQYGTPKCVCYNLSDPEVSYTVSFHNFKSQHFKLSVSNPKNKHVAYLSVRSQISSCQSLGRKNKHENLKTDRSELVSIVIIILILILILIMLVLIAIVIIVLVIITMIILIR